MKSRVLVAVVTGLLAVGCAGSDGGATDDAAEASSARLNAMITLHEAGQPVFGLYAPANRGGRGGAPAESKTPGDLASETLALPSGRSDFVFTGSMEGSVDRGLPGWTAYVDALSEEGASVHTHPLVLKTPKISDDPEAAIENIGRQLDTGASVLMFVEVESAEEVRRGLAAMRYAAD